MDDPLNPTTQSPFLSGDIAKIMEALQKMSEAMDLLGDRVEDANDILYTSSRGGQSFRIDTEAIEQEAEDDIDFLRSTRD